MVQAGAAIMLHPSMLRAVVAALVLVARVPLRDSEQLPRGESR
jgi:hypothetical protein